MDDEVKIFCVTVLLTVIILFFAIVYHRQTVLDCVKILKDKPSAEIIQVCK